MWAYLWDVADVGVERALDEMQGVGVTGVSVATSYHAGRFVQPRLRPSRLYYPEDGTVHVPVDTGEGRIQARASAFAQSHGGLMASLRRETESRGMALSSWTVTLHNSRVGALHLDATVKNAFGAPLVFNLCPSHPDVQRYVVDLTKGLAHRYEVDVLELESLGYMGLVHEYHHEKDGVGLTPAEQFLAGLCFCPHCLADASGAGVDGEHARAFVRTRLEEAFDRELPAPAQPLDELWSEPTLAPYLEQRVNRVHSLIRDVRASLPDHTQLRVLDLFGPREARLYGLDYRRVLADAGSVCCCLYDRSPDQVARAAQGLLDATATPTGVGAGYRLFVPEMRDREDFVAHALAAWRAGIRSFHFYNYGLVPAPRLGWIRAFVEAAR